MIPEDVVAFHNSFATEGDAQRAISIAIGDWCPVLMNSGHMYTFDIGWKHREVFDFSLRDTRPYVMLVGDSSEYRPNELLVYRSPVNVSDHEYRTTTTEIKHTNGSIEVSHVFTSVSFDVVVESYFDVITPYLFTGLQMLYRASKWRSSKTENTVLGMTYAEALVRIQEQKVQEASDGA